MAHRPPGVVLLFRPSGGWRVRVTCDNKQAGAVQAGKVEASEQAVSSESRKMMSKHDHVQSGASCLNHVRNYGLEPCVFTSESNLNCSALSGSRTCKYGASEYQILRVIGGPTRGRAALIG